MAVQVQGKQKGEDRYTDTSEGKGCQAVFQFPYTGGTTGSWLFSTNISYICHSILQLTQLQAHVAFPSAFYSPHLMYFQRTTSRPASCRTTYGAQPHHRIMPTLLSGAYLYLIFFNGLLTTGDVNCVRKRVK